MAILLNPPPHPAIHGSPPSKLIRKNIYYKEYFTALLIGAAGFAFGKFHKQPRSTRRTNAFFFGATGLLG